MTTLPEHHRQTMQIIREAQRIPIGAIDLAKARYELMMAQLDAIRDETDK